MTEYNDWKIWNGGECPVPEGTMGQVQSAAQNRIEAEGTGRPYPLIDILGWVHSGNPQTDMRRVIADSTHWAAISPRAVSAFKSKYSLRFYQFLRLRAGFHKTGDYFTIEDLRKILGVPLGSLTRWPDLRRFALDAAVAEINHLEGFSAVYIPIKQGRKIAGIRLAWGRKAGEELVETIAQEHTDIIAYRTVKEPVVEVDRTKTTFKRADYTLEWTSVNGKVTKVELVK